MIFIGIDNINIINIIGGGNIISILVINWICYNIGIDINIYIY